MTKNLKEIKTSGSASNRIKITNSLFTGTIAIEKLNTNVKSLKEIENRWFIKKRDEIRGEIARHSFNLPFIIDALVIVQQTV